MNVGFCACVPICRGAGIACDRSAIQIVRSSRTAYAVVPTTTADLTGALNDAVEIADGFVEASVQYVSVDAEEVRRKPEVTSCTKSTLSSHWRSVVSSPLLA